MVADRKTLSASREAAATVGAAWRNSDAVGALHTAFAGATTVAAQRRIARRLLQDPTWIDTLLAPLMTALAADPWFEPPFRVARDPIRIGAVIFESPAVTLTATILSADALAAQPPAATIAVSGRVAVTRYHRAGTARLLRWLAGVAPPDLVIADAPPLRTRKVRLLRDGDVVTHDGRTTGHLLERATEDIVMLSFALRGDHAAFVREYDRTTGALRRAATIEERDSRTHMLLTLLRLMQRPDAGGCFDAATRASAFHLRWAAIREWLALDAQAAWPRLGEMAHDDPNPEIRAAAAATVAQFQHRIAA